ncbi:hypothetical protein BKA70DRAFT_1558186 [Coprinopsis sp. MPI-PUGE-AT-0042]|nr:hypothetical protein BKA70DRAFT_1558186 [Coprinopsis sp. MPI-PUGE-AT-0042]
MQRYPLTNTRCVSGLIRSRFPTQLSSARRQLVIGQVRCNSSHSAKSLLSHFVPALVWGTGIGIGCLVVGTGAYYVGGWKEKVEIAHQTLVSVKGIVQGSQNTSKKATEMLDLARGAAKASIAAVIPFGSKLSDPLVDKAFDTVGEAVDAHGEEAKVIITKMMEDIQNAIDSHKEWPTAAAAQVVMIVKRETAKLHELSTKPETQEKISILKQAAIEKSQDGWDRVKGFCEPREPGTRKGVRRRGKYTAGSWRWPED